MSLTPAQLARAAAGYRALIRAQRFTFKGDEFALKNAHRQTRVLFNQFIPSASAFPASSAASTSSAVAAAAPQPTLTSQEVDEHIQSAFEIAAYLRKNVVQGKRTDEGNYTLRFTEETERGSNDTIKAPSNNEARPLRPPTTGNEGVRRRRRKSATTSSAEGDKGGVEVASTACCSGGGSA